MSEPHSPYRKVIHALRRETEIAAEIERLIKDARIAEYGGCFDHDDRNESGDYSECPDGRCYCAVWCKELAARIAAQVSQARQTQRPQPHQEG